MEPTYHYQRAEQERAVAERTPDPIAKRIHLELARLHASRADQLGTERDEAAAGRVASFAL